MNNDLKQFSEERLKDIIELADNPTMVSLARIALSAKQAKPIGYVQPSGLKNLQHGVHDCIWPEVDFDDEDISVYTTPQPAHTEQANPVANEFLPENLDRALTIMGVALPESKEEFNFQVERWVQRLINRVIRYEIELHTEVNSPAIPDGWKLVPIELTEDMLKAGCRFASEHNTKGSWSKMLRAAPKPETK